MKIRQCLEPLTPKQNLLAFLAQYYNHKEVENIVEREDDDELFRWVLQLLLEDLNYRREVEDIIKMLERL